MEGDTALRTLNEAFETFRRASRSLEHRYRLLEKKIERLNQELSEKNRLMERTRRLAAMGEMAAKIAHEIRNPLASIEIFASILVRELEGSDKKRLALSISKGVKRLDNLLTNMLVFARAPKPALARIDVRDVIEEVVQMVSSSLDEPVRIRCEYRRDTVIMADESLLRQVVHNLLINAVDSVRGKNGEIEIITERATNGRDALRLMIRDNGDGIPEDVMDRIFDPFFTTKQRGTGLGLCIVDSIVKSHRGKVWVESAVGRGTTFYVEIPSSIDKEVEG